MKGNREDRLDTESDRVQLFDGIKVRIGVYVTRVWGSKVHTFVNHDNTAYKTGVYGKVLLKKLIGRVS